MSKSPVRILYIEDNRGQARLFQRKLRRAGYDVDLATDGAEGLARVIEGSYDLVVTDHDLPTFDGMRLLQKLQSAIVDPPAVVMITGAGNESIAVEAMKEGASDYLVKDVDGRYLELLPSVIQKTLEQNRLAKENQRSAQALQRSEEKFRAMFEHSPIGMLSCERHGRILQANRAFCELFAYEPNALPQLTCWSLVAGPGVRELEEVLAFFGEGGMFGPVEKSYPRSDGVLIPVLVKGFYYVDSEKQPHIWLFVEDLRARKEMEKRLLQSSKLEAIGELAANIAHEMNNPLGIISAKARLLLFTEKEGMSPKVERELTKIIEQSDRLSRLTRGLLDYSRPSFGAKRPVDLHTPLRKALDILEHRAQTSRVEVIEELAEAPIYVEANPHELEQVFLNLFLNALEAMPGGGSLTLRSGIREEPGEGSVAFVSIEDTGEGIPLEVQPKIFEPFFTTKEEGRGTGLGLSICFGLVRSHQGTIQVKSEEGEGATFTVALPSLQGRRT